MSINKQSDIAANLSIGPTDHGMVRLYVEAKDIQLPLDFDPDEAQEFGMNIASALFSMFGDLFCSVSQGFIKSVIEYLESQLDTKSIARYPEQKRHVVFQQDC